MSVRPDVGLERLIHGLEQELLAAPDEEFVAGARDLGMKPEMRGSAAFLGVKNLSPQLLARLRREYNEALPLPDLAGHPDPEADAASPQPAGAGKHGADR